MTEPARQVTRRHGDKTIRATEAVNNLLRAVHVYVSERRRSEGGWAAIADDDVRGLSEIVHAIIDLKCEPDPDGDRPLEVVVVDRRKEARQWPVTLPTLVDYDKPFEHGGRIDQMVSGLASLADSLRCEIDVLKRKEQVCDD